MGNNGSRSGNVAQRHPIEPEQQWAHSFPRNPHRVYQHKVLPENEIGTKLRCTNNGEILQSGGTISGRHHQQTLSLEREDKSFVSFYFSCFSRYLYILFFDVMFFVGPPTNCFILLQAYMGQVEICFAFHSQFLYIFIFLSKMNFQ